ncbi:alpha/beta fold hydrolase [Mesorhizobium sangaii]|uniref:Pimeloyl-ACP methyl ester carboxylesterase n=1 Tax=Mesorhizobium sangaii TaxID=505389 RepID=A0A841P663_9HYPH|nr:alpha/beta fold hydrolase [Mesorhizobium sangaii]MBB6408813.1 pimeloyl-ACP methyl ester carboxylesterase [Mesorhizobium sangaii]
MPLSSARSDRRQRHNRRTQVPQFRLERILSFAALKQIDAGVLNVGYAQDGPENGPVVILLHGWPYDIHSYVDVAPILAKAGYRVIVPYLRGYGTTRFLSAETPRKGQQAALAVDIIALMDALKIDSAVFGAYDWGARTANIIAALWPERCKALVSVSGYLIGNQQAGKVPLPPKAELQWWLPVLFRDRAWRGRLRQIHARLRAPDLGTRLAAMEVRRRHFRAIGNSFRQSRSCRDPRSTITAGGLGWQRAKHSTTTLRSGSPRLP